VRHNDTCGSLPFGGCREADDGEIVEIVTIVAPFGFLNRWNDTMTTDLELRAFSVANEVIAEAGWEPGKHGAPRTAATPTA